jgi:PilZ domain
VNGHVSHKSECGDEMEQTSGEVRHFQSTRRWPRHQVDLQVRIIALNGILTTPVLARGNEISRGGMALHAPLALYPGDLMQLQFPTSTPSALVKAVVRNRTRECLGLEFLTQVPPDNEPSDRSRFLPSSSLGGPLEARKSVCDSWNPQTLYSGLRRKQEEQRQVQREIEALNMAILLLADDEKELSQAIFLIDSIPHASQG